MSSYWDEQNAEPSLDEILEDPIVRLLMQGDHTGESEVRQLIDRVRTALASSDDDEPAPTTRKAQSKKTTRAA
ncbi:MAG TPA: hypothetical protein VGA60_10755 [Kiloniellales bacterium]|jgi:hypothetical protein